LIIFLFNLKRLSLGLGQEIISDKKGMKNLLNFKEKNLKERKIELNKINMLDQEE